MNARARPLADDQVYAKIFHCRIEDFLDRGLQTVNLVEKETRFPIISVPIGAQRVAPRQSLPWTPSPRFFAHPHRMHLARHRCYAVRAARPFGALRVCSAARNSVSKLFAPASRLPSAAASSAARVS